VSVGSDITDFLAALFGDCEPGILVIGQIGEDQKRVDERGINLSTFWSWPEQSDEVGVWCEAHQDEDLYFSPMLYNRRQRVKDAVSQAPVLWADCDTADPDGYAATPTIVLTTSPGRYQAYWCLKDAAAPQWVEQMSKLVTYSQREAGSDVGGWALTKYMRLPGAVNTKPEVIKANGGPWRVTVEVNGDIYTVEEIEQAFGHVAVPPHLGMAQPLPPSELLPDRNELMDRMPANADINRALTIPPVAKSWNETLWWLECELLRTGLTAAEVFVLTNGCACDKFSRDNRPETELWKDILRAERAVHTSGVLIEADPDRFMAADVPEPPPSLLTEEERQSIPRTFVDEYVEWAASRTNGSVNYQHCAGLTVLSTVLADYGHACPQFGDLPLNMWFMLIGVTTRTYKTTSKNLMLEVLRPLQNEDYDYDIGSDASPEGLLVALLEHPGRSVLFHRDEAHGMIYDSKGGKTYMAGFGEMLTELYDGWARGRLRSNRQERRTASAKICFNLFLLGVPEKLASSLTQEDFASGFMPRFVFALGAPDNTPGATTLNQASVVGKGRVDKQLTKLQNRVLKMRKKWSEVTDPGEQVAVRSDDEAWDRLNVAVEALRQLAVHSEIPTVMEPVVGRMNLMIIKCATLLAMADHHQTVTLPYMLAAIAYAEQWYAAVFTMAKMVGRNDFSALVQSLVAYVQGQHGNVKVASARRHFHNLEGRRWKDMIEAAEQQQLVKQVLVAGVPHLREW
jgi:hypothetical protein